MYNVTVEVYTIKELLHHKALRSSFNHWGYIRGFFLGEDIEPSLRMYLGEIK